MALCESVYKTVCECILIEYTDLKLVYHHTGGNVACMFRRIELYLRSDWWPGQDRLPSLSAFHAGLEQTYVDTAGFSAHRTPVTAALDAFSAENMLLVRIVRSKSVQLVT